MTVRVLASYGAALRRSGRVTEAREALYRAIDMAVDMGMERLTTHVYEELVLAGGRPRRARTSGPQSLTAAQQQVASMAADGQTNRQIAEGLFVTIKTVETHLAAVYRKLDITTRDELTDLLGAAEGTSRDDQFGRGHVLTTVPAWADIGAPARESVWAPWA